MTAYEPTRGRSNLVRPLPRASFVVLPIGSPTYHHDVIDAIRAEVVAYQDLPFQAQALFGDNHSQWVGTMIHAVVDGSLTAGEVVMDAEICPGHAGTA